MAAVYRTRQQKLQGVRLSGAETHPRPHNILILIQNLPEEKQYKTRIIDKRNRYHRGLASKSKGHYCPRRACAPLNRETPMAGSTTIVGLCLGVSLQA